MVDLAGLRSLGLALITLLGLRQQQLLTLLLENKEGLTVEELTTPAALEVKVFRIEEVTKKQRLFEGHHEITLRGNYEDEKLEFAQGTLLVRGAQPLGRARRHALTRRARRSAPPELPPAPARG